MKRCKVCGYQATKVVGGYVCENPICPMQALTPEMMQASLFKVKGEENE